MTPHTSPLFEGCATALVTPFQNGEVDKTSFLRLLHRFAVPLPRWGRQRTINCNLKNRNKIPKTSCNFRDYKV